MKGILRASMLSSTLVLLLAITASWTTVVRADEATPPPDAPTETAPVQGEPGADQGTVSQPVSADVVSTEPAPIDAASPTEEIAATQEPAAEAAPTEVAPLADQAATAEPTTEATDTVVAPVEEVTPPETSVDAATLPLDQLPEGTDVVVLDAAGESLPLGTQEAADVVATGDPMWCPVGVVPGGVGCSPKYNTSLQAVIQWLGETSPTKAGVIWIEKDYDRTTGDPLATQFTFDGGTLTSIAGLSLTIQGGWNGCTPSCVNTIDASHPSVINGAALSITAWNGDVTLNNLTITGVTVADSTALSIDTTKRVTLNHVKVDNNAGSGARIDADGDVSVKSSQFNGNANGDGLSVLSSGNITASDLTATDNGLDGARLDNCLAAAPANCVTTLAKTITLSGLNIFAANGQNGLEASSTGSIAASNIKADANGAWGAHLDNNRATCCSASITLTGLNEFNYNGEAGAGGGLWVKAAVGLTAHSLTAVGNTGDGANLCVDYGCKVTLTGTNTFYDNSGTGLNLWADSGISLNNLTASNNGHDGVHIRSAGNWPTTIVGFGTFNGNGWNGLIAYVEGPVTLATVTANNNGWQDLVPTWDDHPGDGVNIQGATNEAYFPSVKLTGVNTFIGNWFRGLEIVTHGPISVSSLTASENGKGADKYYGDGAYLIGECYGCPNPPVTLTLSNNFNGNAEKGLYAQTSGNITVSNLRASANGGQGAELWSNHGSVSILGYAEFRGNLGGGLSVMAEGGSTTVENLSAINNPGGGAGLGNGNVTLKGTTIVQGNGSVGLNINSFGLVNITNLHANDNGSWGASLSGTKGLFLAGTNSFCNNGRDGLWIWEGGPVALSNVTATGNAEIGVNIDTAAPGATGGVTLLGYGIFNNNGYDGLYVSTNGAITLANVTANGNGTKEFVPTESDYWGDGARLENLYDPSAPRNVTLTGTNTFNNNWARGLEIWTFGAILTNNLTANANGQGGYDDLGYGAYMDNGLCYAGSCYATLPRPIVLNGTNVFESNWDDGLDVRSIGTITINSITASDNGFAGAYLDNQWDQAIPANLSINGYGRFDDNYAGPGLVVFSHGNVSIANLTASGNWWLPFFGVNIGGAFLNVSRDVGNSNIYLTGTTVLEGNGNSVTNSGIGLYAEADGLISAANLRANGNAGDGAQLKAGTAAILSGTNLLNGNGLRGLTVDSTGSATFSNLSVDDNGADGAVVTVGTKLQLLGLNAFDGNTLGGFSAKAGGAITISSISADGNLGNDGVRLDNTPAGTTATPPGVTIIGSSHFVNNWNHGLKILTWGSVTLGGITANDNGVSGTSGSGVEILNVGGSVARNVILNGMNSFNGNWNYGLYVDATGAVVVQRPAADENGRGVDIKNTGLAASATSPGVRIIGPSQANGNRTGGFLIQSCGPISLDNVTANGNPFGDGAALSNDYAVVAMPVTLTGTNTFLGNGSTGLYIRSIGPVSLNNIGADGNGIVGASIYNPWSAPGLPPQNVTLTGSSHFNDNRRGGLQVISSGAISANNLTANSNGDGGRPMEIGVWLDNCLEYEGSCQSGVSKPITLTGVNTFLGNYGDGLYIYATGDVSVQQVHSSGNGWDSAAVINPKGSGVWVNAVGDITLTCGSLNYNGNTTWGGAGYELDSGGTITLIAITTLGNQTANVSSDPDPVIVPTCPLP